MSNLGKDTTERDLWDFDNEPEQPAQAKPAVPRVEPITKPRQPAKGPAAKALPKGDPEKLPIEKSRSSPDRDFDDLEAWDDLPAAIDPPRPVEAKRPDPEPEPVAEETVPEPVETPAAPPVAAPDEFSPAVKSDAAPVSLRPKLGLTVIERIGLGVFLVLMAIGAAFFLMHSVNRLPGESERVEENDFPIKGGILSIASAESYWREPIAEGPNADAFRRGTRLLPVLKLTVDGGSGAIRVLFRNSKGESVGDAVIRRSTGGTLEIPATAGFDDVGMYAAYRAGESKPWTVEVHEGPSEDAPSAKFASLFVMSISTDRR